MYLRLGIVICASVLLVTVRPDPKSPACTRFIDLSTPCGCIQSHIMSGPEEPVCGSDGYTYLSACFLECKKTIDKTNLSIVHEGSCTKDSLCACDARYAPKCGSNGVTYSNQCVLECFMKKDRSIQFHYDGECSKQRLSNYDPRICRCSSNEDSYYSRYGDNRGNTRSRCSCISKQKLQRTINNQYHGLQAQSMRSCPEDSNEPQVTVLSDKCVCAAHHAPVCATNHKTYTNFCVFYCAARRYPCVRLKHWGECKDTD